MLDKDGVSAALILLPLSVCLAEFMCGTDVLDKDGVLAAPVLLLLSMCLAGFMCGTNVLDKDGVSAAAIVAEFASQLYAQNLTLEKQLEAIYAK